MRAKVKLPTAAEEAAIQRGIAHDSDAAELTDAQLAEMRPAAEMLPPDIGAGSTRRRGRGRTPPKVVVSLRLPPEVRDRLKSRGPGWQTWAAKVLMTAADNEAPQARNEGEPHR